MNLYSKKVPELFRLAIGFKNQVCCNMWIFTDGYKYDLRFSNTSELYSSALELFNNYNPAKHLNFMQKTFFLKPIANLNNSGTFLLYKFIWL